jgi:hypothetical protein
LTSAVIDTAKVLLPEAQVLKQWPCLSTTGLRAARKSGKIRWYKGKRSSAWYLPEDIWTFIANNMEASWQGHVQNRCSNLQGNGSPTSMEPETFIDSGMTLELEEHAARASARRILKSQNAGSLN